MDACTSQDPDIISSMISYLAQTDSYFGDHQRDAENLSLEKKAIFLRSVLDQSAATFLTRYGIQLKDEHINYFTEKFAEDKDLMYQLKILKRELKAADQRVKNRRFVAMRGLLAAGEYFSDEQMKHRDPLLYEQMVGRHLTDDDIKSQSDNLLRQHTGFSTMLLEQMDSRGNNELYTRQLSREESQLEEEDSESDEECTPADDENNGISPDERIALREEFLHVMQERFLAGQDQEFDYSSVDGNCKYDDLVQEGRDAEEAYFDETDEDDLSVAHVSSLAPDEYDY